MLVHKFYLLLSLSGWLLHVCYFCCAARLKSLKGTGFCYVKRQKNLKIRQHSAKSLFSYFLPYGAQISWITTWYYTIIYSQ